jgi:hypothetical protein
MAKMLLTIITIFLTTACATTSNQERTKVITSSASSSFTLAVIPDTQNYLDFENQKSSGFAFNANELFIQQMQYIAKNSVSNGGDIAFVASVGDVWQHQTKVSDKDHQSRGIIYTPNPIIESMVKVTPQTLTIEIPKAVEGYQILSDAGIRFGVAPGNHDYDAIWTTTKYPPNLDKPRSELSMTPGDIGVLHVGGLDNFKSVFGSDGHFYKNKPWYIASHNGGTSSAQKFSAGGYTFLHIALEMHPGDHVIDWAKSVMAANSSLPTIFSTHDYLSIDGERKGSPVEDLATVDPDEHNNAQAVWDKLYSQHSQILLVLSGHQHGQSYRVDQNKDGHLIYQILADYQDRSQVSKDTKQSHSTKLGDGWLRLMQFDLASEVPTIAVKTYSSYYEKFSSEEKNYSSWYKEDEHSELSDAEFLKTDDYVLTLTDFHSRFKADTH